MKRLCKLLCCCLYSKKNKKKEKLLEGEELSDTEFSDDLSESSTSSGEILNTAMVFPSKVYRKDEKEISLNLSKEKIVEITNKEFLVCNDYKIFYKKDGLILSSKESSLLTNKFPLIKMEYKISKSEFKKNINKEDIINTLKDIKNRKKWDENIKEIKIIEEYENSYLIHTSYNKPIFFISERDILEKKVEFYFNNNYYSYCSSVSHELNEKYKENKNVVRIFNYISVYKIEEDENYFYFKSLNQIDYKMNVPNNLMNITLPIKIINWYKKLESVVVKEKEIDVNED
jgi:hypothetical protein